MNEIAERAKEKLSKILNDCVCPNCKQETTLERAYFEDKISIEFFCNHCHELTVVSVEPCDIEINQNMWIFPSEDWK